MSKKISQLPEAITISPDVDYFPITNDGFTKKVKASNFNLFLSRN
jgi:hypothetical protein